MRQWIIVAITAFAMGCKGTAFESGWTSGDEESDTFGQGGEGKGARCDPEKTCGAGLVCSKVDDSCHIDCASGYACDSGQVCSGQDGGCWPAGSPGTAGINGTCNASYECAYGLVCNADATCQKSGDPGTKAAGETCELSTECQLYLECIDGTCQGYVPPFWSGAECGVDAPDAEAFRLYFEVSSSSGEFYRLPFPNDIRRSGGHIDLSAYALPDLEIPGAGTPPAELLDMVENDVGGFGLNSFVFFRFNRNAGPQSMSHQNFGIYNIDPKSASYGEKASAEWRASSGQGRYICRNWLALGPTLGRPLLPGTTYAAIVTTRVTDPNGQPAHQDADFTTMLSSSRPSGPTLAKAWEAYAPLRAYLEDKSIDPQSIAGAAVFTTADPQAHLPALRKAVRSEPEPEVTGLSIRENESHKYTLYTGLVTIPTFQDGIRPFLRPQDGGAIAYDESGTPIVVEEEMVHWALSIPTQQRPENGWPIVIYAHGTGGSELSLEKDSLAVRFADIGVAVIGLEQVMHGDRRGLTQEQEGLEAFAPERLVFNLLSPRAARDNQMQAAADHFQLIRLIERFADITGRTEAVFDPERIAFFGHSQGAQGPFLFAVHEPAVRLIVLSGAGGNLVESLLGKKHPIDMKLMTSLALFDPSVDRYHPFLNLVQTAFDAVDPLCFASTALREDYDGLGYPKRHVFMSYGIEDSYTPPRSQTALAKELGVRQWAIPGQELEYILAVEELPYTGSPVTGVVVQYESSDHSDAHFVMFENPSAVTQTDAFVQTFAQTGIATLVDPAEWND